ncbi:tyrosine-type recombinase/integrase [Microbacterium lushaniae]|uniref:tyrosine-type recombinase/integrase n=1 Tax=Microbacterium lushaniae TaxID=2614639 RepID=UPI001EE973ED|nr:tyrosine-type recombinase/integrase [Microbacterium lushaniae]
MTGTPKTHATRSVPYPEFLEDLIRIQLHLKRPKHLLFGNGSEPQRLPNSRDGWFAAAVRRAMRVDPTFPRITPHDLRHTAASLAISAGANVKAVQRMLGHASAAMTLDTYADLFDDDLDYVAQALTSARHAAVVVVQEQQARGASIRPSAILPPMPSPGSPRDAARGL